MNSKGNSRTNLMFIILGALFLLVSATIANAACNQPPIPSPGQTVTWLAANSPFQICADLNIPKRGTVIVQPGVQLQFQGATLTVSGALKATGQSANHISIVAQDVFPPAITVEGGNLMMSFADVGGQIRPGPGKITISDSTFTGPNGLIFTNDILLPSLPPVIKLTRCKFNNTLMEITDSYLALANSSFTNTTTQVLRGYVRLVGTNRFDGQPLVILRETFQSIQPLFVDGVNAKNVPTGGGISLTGGNFLLGSKNVLQGNLYPVDVEGGLLPLSLVPLTGNTNNMIWAHDGAAGPVARWSNFGLPYLVDGYIFGGGTLTIDPGVTVLFDPTKVGFAGLNLVSTRRLIANGLPTAPITFDALHPGNPWNGLLFQENITEGSHLDYVVVRNGQFGASSSDNFLQISNSLFENNQVALNTNTFGVLTASKTRVLNNVTGAEAHPDGQLVLSAPNFVGNWFQGNGTAVVNAGPTAPAQLNYWGSSTGPKTPSNPGGQGDPITGPITFKPFLTSPPNIANNPPVVGMVPFGFSWYGITTIIRPPEFVAHTGEKLLLRWNVSNSGTVAKQRILLSPTASDFDTASANPIVLADNLSPSTTTMEVTVPSVPFQATNINQFLRIVAIDSSGQQGWDQTPLIVPTGNISGNIQITSDYSGQTFIGGHPAPAIKWTGSANGGNTEAFIFLESDGGLVSLFGGSATLPILSTDTARLAIRSSNNSNELEWFFSNTYFSIRPDPALGLKPPVVQLTSPTPGSTFAGGSVVPITWTASGKQGLQSFDIQVSTDGGQTFHLVTTDLSASTRSFNWQLPASAGIPDVRVRVIARDKLFQDSSDGAKVVFSITP
jgi:Bacterial Ig domain